MFGHQDDSSPQAEDKPGDLIEQAVSAEASAADRPSGEPALPGALAGSQPAATPPPDLPTAGPSISPTDSPATETPAETSITKPAEGSAEPDADPDKVKDIISPAGGFPKRPSFQYADGGPAAGSQSSDKADTDPLIRDLLKIRHDALEELSPLIEKLDLPPVDKFRIIMMIIQEDDDESLVKSAYEAAHAIEDEKVRAQALFDIVNEVNYFTAPPEDDDRAAVSAG